MKKLLLTLAATMCLSQAFADKHADSDLYEWYISPSGSYTLSEQARSNNDSHGYAAQILFGKQVSNRFNIEMGPEVNKFENFGSSKISQPGFKANSLFFFDREGLTQPYLITGIGIYNTSETDDTNPIYSVGIGAMNKVKLWDDTKLRTELTFQQEIDSSELKYDDVKLTIGLYAPLGKKPVKLVKATPLDSDNDGVFDANDQCPNTPTGAMVNDFGCELDSDNDGVVNSQDVCPNTPAGTKVNARGCKVMLDSDNDGVNDSVDQCPNTPAGRAVDVRGCALPLDSDNDGVTNNKDQCPNTPIGARVDFKGCEIKAVISLPEVNFEFDSAKLKASSYPTLDGAVETMQKFTDIRAIVAGHTDSIGNDAYNLALSNRRAASVRNYMISKGVSADRLIAKGYGETRPILDNSSDEGRRVNRRVDLDVQK